MVGCDIVYVQVVMQVIQIRRECEVQSEITIVMQDGQDGSRYPSLLLHWLEVVEPRVYITTPWRSAWEI